MKFQMHTVFSDFSQLGTGDLFKVTPNAHQGETLYIRTTDIASEKTVRANCVDLNTGCLWYFSNDEKVIRIEGTFFENGKPPFGLGSINIDYDRED